MKVSGNYKWVVSGILACIPLTSCSKSAVSASAAAPAENVPVRAALAVRQNVPYEISAVGNVEAIENVEVKSRIGGQIDRVAFTEGQNVAKGQLLFTIDQSALERQIAEEQAQIERDAAMEQQARAVVARDVASQKQSQSEADVAQKLGTLGVISGQRVSQLLTTSDTATAGLRSDQAAVDAAVGVTKADRAHLAQTQLQLNFASIVAPISGRAGAVAVKTGNIVRENDTTLVTLLQLAPIHVTFGVPEQVLPQIQQLNAHSPLAVEASNGDGPVLRGQLDFIDNTVDANTGTIHLKAVFPNANASLWPGQFVNVRLRLRVEPNEILVPESSVQNGQDGKYAWLVKSGVATMVPVTVQRTYKPETGPGQAVIATGISPGDTVITEGQLRLTPGAHVSFLESPRPMTQASAGDAHDPAKPES